MGLLSMKGSLVPDIALRFHKDMLVLASPLESELERLGFNPNTDMEYVYMMEPDSVQDALRVEVMAGAQCLIANAADLTPIRQLKVGAQEHTQEILSQSLRLVREFKPQHLLVEVGPCGLPLDPSSKGSLNENRDQYARAARLLSGEEYDAVFLNGFTDANDMQCALMGMRKVLDDPIFASLEVDAQGNLARADQSLETAVGMMQEYGASVVGIATSAGIEDAVSIARRMAEACTVPLLIQLRVDHIDAEQEYPTKENPYFGPDTMMDAATALHAQGVQFLRAIGAATPAYTGALYAATIGVDVATNRADAAPCKSDEPTGKAAQSAAGEGFVLEGDDLQEHVADLRARIAAALDKGE